MPGAIAPNLHQGDRSEIIADYLFSTWGTVTPVRRQDDFGVDLYCTLTETVGQRAMVTGYYSVQVKSNSNAWFFAEVDEVRWLIDHPTPLFLACVNKSGGVLSVYQTIARFVAGLEADSHDLELLPSDDDEGRLISWYEGQRLSLSAPILRVTLSDFCDPVKLDKFRSVLRFWVDLDQRNCALRRMGVLRVQMPSHYRVNELPDMSDGLSECGHYFSGSAPQLKEALSALAVQLDYAGSVLLARGDGRAALLSALLLKHVRETQTVQQHGLPATWCGMPWSLESEVGARLDGYPQNGKGSCDPVKALADVSTQLDRLDLAARFLGSESGNSTSTTS